MKYGTAVVYEGANGEQFALITDHDSGPKADLLVFNNDGVGTVHKDVPRSDNGGGHTWRPAK